MHRLIIIALTTLMSCLMMDTKCNNSTINRKHEITEEEAIANDDKLKFIAHTCKELKSTINITPDLEFLSYPCKILLMPS